MVTVAEVADGSEKSGGSRCPSSPASRETSPLSPVTKLGKALRRADPIAKVGFPRPRKQMPPLGNGVVCTLESSGDRLFCRDKDGSKLRGYVALVWLSETGPKRTYRVSCLFVVQLSISYCPFAKNEKTAASK